MQDLLSGIINAISIFLTICYIVVGLFFLLEPGDHKLIGVLSIVLAVYMIGIVFIMFKLRLRRYEQIIHSQKIYSNLKT